MRKLNLFHIVIPIILLFFCFNIVSFASQEKLPDNFINMSAEQRIQWLDQNIPQKTEYATRINSSRSTVPQYRVTKKNAYTDEAETAIVGISVTYEWSVTPAGKVEPYEVADFSTYIYNPSFVFVNKEVTDFYVNDTNVKIYPEATFASAYMGILVGQNVNLHASGKYSYEGIAQPFSR